MARIAFRIFKQSKCCENNILLTITSHFCDVAPAIAYFAWKLSIMALTFLEVGFHGVIINKIYSLLPSTIYILSEPTAHRIFIVPKPGE